MFGGGRRVSASEECRAQKVYVRRDGLEKRGCRQGHFRRDTQTGNWRQQKLKDFRPPPPQSRARARAQLEFFSQRNGVMPASGHVFMCGPLSVEYCTSVSSLRPIASTRSSSWPTTLSWSTIVSWYLFCFFLVVGVVLVVLRGGVDCDCE